MSDQPRRRRRAVGPKGSVPTTDEPLPERSESKDDKDVERLLRDVPPHHGRV